MTYHFRNNSTFETRNVKFVCVHVVLSVHADICAFVCVCVFVYIYIYIYIYMYAFFHSVVMKLDSAEKYLLKISDFILWGF